MITILTSEDLIDKAKGTNKKIEHFYFPSIDIVNKSSFIIYIHDDRRFKILKNRYSDDSPETYGILDLLKLN